MNKRASVLSSTKTIFSDARWLHLIVFSTVWTNEDSMSSWPQLKGQVQEHVHGIVYMKCWKISTLQQHTTGTSLVPSTVLGSEQALVPNSEGCYTTKPEASAASTTGKQLNEFRSSLGIEARAERIHKGYFGLLFCKGYSLVLLEVVLILLFLGVYSLWSSFS